MICLFTMVIAKLITKIYRQKYCFKTKLYYVNEYIPLRIVQNFYPFLDRRLVFVVILQNLFRTADLKWQLPVKWVHLFTQKYTKISIFNKWSIILQNKTEKEMIFFSINQSFKIVMVNYINHHFTYRILYQIKNNLNKITPNNLIKLNLFQISYYTYH